MSDNCYLCKEKINKKSRNWKVTKTKDKTKIFTHNECIKNFIDKQILIHK